MAFHLFRDTDGSEVAIVIERGPQTVAGSQVKAAATVTRPDFRGPRKLKSIAAGRFACGVVLYDGETVICFGEKLVALPVRTLWETTPPIDLAPELN